MLTAFLNPHPGPWYQEILYVTRALFNRGLLLIVATLPRLPYLKLSVTYALVWKHITPHSSKEGSTLRTLLRSNCWMAWLVVLLLD
jgi:hypothetical protein